MTWSERRWAGSTLASAKTQKSGLWNCKTMCSALMTARSLSTPHSSSAGKGSWLQQTDLYMQTAAEVLLIDCLFHCTLLHVIEEHSYACMAGSCQAKWYGHLTIQTVSASWSQRTLAIAHVTVRRPVHSMRWSCCNTETSMSAEPPGTGKQSACLPCLRTLWQSCHSCL